MTEESWDVYPVHAIKSTSVAFRLLSETKSISKLRGTVVLVDWDDSQQPAKAKHLDFEQKVKVLEDRAQDLEQRPQEARNNYASDSFTTVKKSRKLVRRLENFLEKPSETFVEAEKVNIGEGILVEKSPLNQLHNHCHWLPTKFAQNQVRHLFIEEEPKGKSLYGRGSNKHKEVPMKEALDPVWLNSVIWYTCSKFTISTVQLKNSLSFMLRREIK
ncbi:hypothetical protein MRX96_006328 [Rhipicephalus microplus]